MRLAITCGLPCSGKAEFVQHMKQEGWVLLDPVNFRHAFSGEVFVKELENLVWAHVEVATKALLDAGHNVLVSGMHPTALKRRGWKALAKQFDAKLEIYYFNLKPELCKEISLENGWDPDYVDRVRHYFEKPRKSEGTLYIMYENGEMPMVELDAEQKTITS